MTQLLSSPFRTYRKYLLFPSKYIWFSRCKMWIFFKCIFQSQKRHNDLTNPGEWTPPFLLMNQSRRTCKLHQGRRKVSNPRSLWFTVNLKEQFDSWLLRETSLSILHSNESFWSSLPFLLWIPQEYKREWRPLLAPKEFLWECKYLHWCPFNFST